MISKVVFYKIKFCVDFDGLLQEFRYFNQEGIKLVEEFVEYCDKFSSNFEIIF